MANEVAGDDELFVCLACGKMSKDRYGFQKISSGWDESCMMNCDKFKKSNLIIENGRVTRVESSDRSHIEAFYNRYDE